MNFALLEALVKDYEESTKTIERIIVRGAKRYRDSFKLNHMSSINVQMNPLLKKKGESRFVE